MQTDGRFGIRVAGVGHAMYAAGAAGLGVLLLSDHFVYVYAPLPQWIPWRGGLACASGALLLIAGLLLVWQRTVVLASAVLASFYLSWLLLLHMPLLIAKASKENLWSGAAQLVSLVAGGWLLFTFFAPPTEGPGRWLRGDCGARVARVAYALALPMFGLHHFLTVGAAEAVPAWLPFRQGWADLTGVAHIAAGLAILFRIVPRLAATLEAIMISAFVVLVHVTGVIEAPRDRLQWSMLADALAIGGAAWIAARSYGGGGASSRRRA